MTLSTIPADVDTSADSDGEYDPVEAFLKGLVGEEKSSTEPRKKRTEAPADTRPTQETEEDEEAPEESPEDPSDDEHDTEETPAEEAEEAPKVASDDAEVEITVDGEVRKASVKDLKRLYGQEAALTRKGQELAATRKAVEDQAQVYGTGLQKMREAAEARWKEYEQVDYLLARDRMDPGEFQRLREAATKAYQEFKFFDEELKGHAEAQTKADQTRLREAATACVKALTSDFLEDGSPNPARIEGWGDEVYNGLRTFAVQELGFDQRAIDAVVNPSALKTLWMAQQWHKAQKAAKATAKPKPAVAAPKKALTSKQAVEGDKPANARSKDAMSRLRVDGSLDSAADAFLASFEPDA